jgi:CheY-like chemotaxis protein
MKSACRALLVEDSLDDAFFFHRALKKGSVECDLRHVLDGQAAVACLQEGAAKPEILPSIVFLDLKMPVMNGFEVLEWLGQQRIKNSVLVVVLSGSNQESDKKRAKELGAAGYMVKPVSPEQLAGWIEKVHGEPSAADK